MVAMETIGVRGGSRTASSRAANPENPERCVTVTRPASIRAVLRLVVPNRAEPSRAVPSRAALIKAVANKPAAVPVGVARGVAASSSALAQSSRNFYAGPSAARAVSGKKPKRALLKPRRRRITRSDAVIVFAGMT